MKLYELFKNSHESFREGETSWSKVREVADKLEGPREDVDEAAPDEGP